MFDTRGFGKTSVGDPLTSFSTSSMAVDVLAILCHLRWVIPSPSSPYLPLSTPSPSPSPSPSTPSSPSSLLLTPAPPTIHIVSWSLGGMICQELSFLLLSPSSSLSHSLASLVFTSSSPGGYRDPDEPTLSYFLRNQPPWSGFKTILRVIFSWSRERRIRWLLRLHYAEEWLDKEWVGERGEEEEECFCVEGCERAAVRGMGRLERKEERREERRQARRRATGVDCDDSGDDAEDDGGDLSPMAPPSAPLPSTAAIGRRLRNRDVLAEIYASRSPFDRNVLGYLYSLAHHVVAVYTHAFSRERFHLLHQYNTTTTHQAGGEGGHAASRTYTKTTTSITMPSSLPAPSALTQPTTRRVHPLVLVGDHDELIAPQNSLTLAKYLRCACLIFRDSGHMIYVEHPQAFADILHRHFRVAREGGSGRGWYEDEVIKVEDYTQSVRGGERRLSTISTSLSSGTRRVQGEGAAAAEEGEEGKKGGGLGVWGVSGWRSLLTCFFVWKLLSSLPPLRVRFQPSWMTSFREVVRPLLLLYQHLRSLLLWRVRSTLQWMAGVS